MIFLQNVSIMRQVTMQQAVNLINKHKGKQETRHKCNIQVAL